MHPFSTQGFLIDGYPLDRDQAAAFFNDIANPSIVICLEIPDDVALSRLRTRDSFDDNVRSIKKRLETWNQNTKQIAKAFNAIIIDADQPANDVLANVEKALE
jgi:adenylate kinase family enzyme